MIATVAEVSETFWELPFTEFLRLACLDQTRALLQA
jgi:hypothetical protein